MGIIWNYGVFLIMGNAGFILSTVGRSFLRLISFLWGLRAGV